MPLYGCGRGGGVGWGDAGTERAGATDAGAEREEAVGTSPPRPAPARRPDTRCACGMQCSSLAVGLGKAGRPDARAGGTRRHAHRRLRRQARPLSSDPTNARKARAAARNELGWWPLPRAVGLSAARSEAGRAARARARFVGADTAAPTRPSDPPPSSFTLCKTKLLVVSHAAWRPAPRRRAR